jgi:hypothetical protein
MQIRFGKRRRIRFTDKTHPAAGILSVVMGTVAWIVLIILVMISGAAGGKSGLALGVAGLLDLVFSAVGFWLAMRCYKKEDIYMTTPAAGTVLNGLLVLGLVILYVIGAV